MVGCEYGHWQKNRLSFRESEGYKIVDSQGIRRKSGVRCFCVVAGLIF